MYVQHAKRMHMLSHAMADCIPSTVMWVTATLLPKCSSTYWQDAGSSGGFI